MNEKPWYSDLYDETDDALVRGLSLLEELRSALPKEKQGAVDEAKALLCRAAKIYKETQKRLEEEAHEKPPQS